LGFIDSWDVGSGATQRRMTLRTLVPTAVGPALIPIVFPEDLGLSLEASYATPVPYIDYMSLPASRDLEGVRLLPCLDAEPLTPGHTLQQRTESRGDVTIASSFYWPPAPTGAVAGYTAPLDRWEGTTISGVVSQPIELHGFFSQTYRPEHHNFAENFLFDPHLEPGVDAGLLAEWRARGIQALVQPAYFSGESLRVLTLDGEIVPLDELP
jgi:hypothetical protein